MDTSGKRTNRPKARQSIAHVPDRQNATIDLSSTRSGQRSDHDVPRRKLRGKSLGPGGLEALTESDGNTTKTISNALPKSILKPTVPLTPPKSIPTFDELRQRSTRKQSPLKNSTEALLIDFSTPAPLHESSVPVDKQNGPAMFDPFSPVKSTQGDVQEQERLRQEQKKIILEQRAARRKSMANRRVSFAPEATLHTWSVMEMVEDSTTSSASNSTRRQSSMTAQDTPQRDVSTLLEEATVLASASTSSQPHTGLPMEGSPNHDGEAHRLQHAHVSPEADNLDEFSGDEVYSSSPSGDGAPESSPARASDDDEESDTDGDTAMSIEEMTQNTVRSHSSGSSTQSSLEGRLRQAATQAGTRGIGYDEFGEDVSMEIADNTVTSAFQPWTRGQQSWDDKENLYPSLPATEPSSPEKASESTAYDMTQGVLMDMTEAVGGILKANTNTSRRKSTINRRQSIAADSSYGDESMDLTAVTGGIWLSGSPEDDAKDDRRISRSSASDEEMTMDFTTAVGGVNALLQQEIAQQSPNSTGDDTMDVTRAIGGILETIEEQTEPLIEVIPEDTATMDMTVAAGRILAPTIAPDTSRTSASTEVNLTPRRLTVTTTESGSPSLTVKSRTASQTRSRSAPAVTTPRSSTKHSPRKVTSAAKQVTPSKQLTPIPTKATSPERTPVQLHVSHRGASPKKLFQAEIKARVPVIAQRTTETQKNLLFAQDEATGQQTPRVVLHASKPPQPVRRRSSGLGIDNEGFGSPSVTQLLSRRTSIGDTASQFKLDPVQTPKLRFEDPKLVADEIEAVRAEDQLRESGTTDQQDPPTMQLRDVIEAMSPAKGDRTKLKGRKSLAVGSARGVLGKRPVELDEDDAEDDLTPKRLKAASREGSPVKKVLLPKPPSKEETTGRLAWAEKSALDANIRLEQDTAQKNVSQALANSQTDSTEGVVRDKISLQDFLNMTKIHFIELDTAKRRHTLARNQKNGSRSDKDRQSSSTQTCFVTAATTIPLLELYQHATKELKSYISTGRKIVRTIESETLNEQPALFREYVEAQPDVKLIMDNQFRNGKTNARLQSKEGWYAWRSQLIDGVRDGLREIETDLRRDLITVESQSKSLSELTDHFSDRRHQLRTERQIFQQQLEEIDSVDHQQLKVCRKKLRSADRQLAEKHRMLDMLKRQFHEREEMLTQAAELQEEMHNQIAEAERVREEHRRWATKDVLTMKTNVAYLEKQSGWSLRAAEEAPDEKSDSGVALTLAYKNELRLFFHPTAFEHCSSEPRRRSGRNSRSASDPTTPISLTTLPSSEESTTDLTTEKRFLLQFIQSHLQSLSMMPRGVVSPKAILDAVSSGWDLAGQLFEEIRLLNLAGMARVAITGDEKLGIRTLLLLSCGGRVDVHFSSLVSSSDGKGVTASTSASVLPIYGLPMDILNSSKLRKVETAMNKEIDMVSFGQGSLVNAVRAFEDWYVSQIGKREQQHKDEKLVLSLLSQNGEDVPYERSEPVASTTPKSPVPTRSKSSIATSKRSPLAAKKSSTVQKKIPVSVARQEKFRTSQRDTQVLTEKDKENDDPFGGDTAYKPPAITPQMQEAMMERTPIKRIGALRRSPA